MAIKDVLRKALRTLAAVGIAFATTTATGGRSASTAVAMMTFHSFCASPVPIIRVRPTTTVARDGSLTTSSGQRYWLYM